jgi:PAP2 superfamily
VDWFSFFGNQHSSKPMNRTAKILSTLVLIAGFLWLGTSTKFYTEALISAFFALALASVLIIQFRVRPSIHDAFLVLAAAAFLAVIDFQLLHFKPAIMAWVSFAGLGSFFIFGLRTVWAAEADRRLMLLAFIPSLLFVSSEYFADDMLQWTSSIHPKVFDLYLYSFDASLHAQLPFLLGQWFAKWPNLRFTGLIFYIALAIPIALIYVGRLLRIGDKAIPSFLAFLATGPIGVLFYNMLPALGPAHLFGQNFPWAPLSITQASKLLVEQVPLTGAPNAIPSLHMAWVLLVWWYSRGLSWWERAIAFLFVFFTVLATMGTGEHYFIDLVVAFPFALCIEALFAFAIPLLNARRLTALGFGLLATLSWLLSLRYATHFFWSSPIVPWGLCAFTVAFSILIEVRLQIPATHKSSEPLTATPALESLS